MTKTVFSNMSTLGQGLQVEQSLCKTREPCTANPGFFSLQSIIKKNIFGPSSLANTSLVAGPPRRNRRGFQHLLEQLVILVKDSY